MQCQLAARVPSARQAGGGAVLPTPQRPNVPKAAAKRLCEAARRLASRRMLDARVAPLNSPTLITPAHPLLPPCYHQQPYKLSSCLPSLLTSSLLRLPSPLLRLPSPLLRLPSPAFPLLPSLSSLLTPPPLSCLPSSPFLSCLASPLLRSLSLSPDTTPSDEVQHPRLPNFKHILHHSLNHHWRQSA